MILKKRLEDLICESVNVPTVSFWAGKIAEYLILNGVVVLPCKVGDTVYGINNTNIVIECVIKDISISNFGIIYRAFMVNDDFTRPVDFLERDFGITIFLNREEAETELRRRKGEVDNGCENSD